METIQKRNEYINQKMLQLDEITDGHKYTRRLSRVMLYHKLLSVRESAAVNHILKEEVRGMNTCTFCGRQDDQDTKTVGGYTILETCTDCEEEILNEE